MSRKAERSVEVYKRLYTIAREMRELSKEIGCKISLATYISPYYGEEKPVSSTIFIGDAYRMDHFSSGHERLSYKHMEIQPEQFIPGKDPFEPEIVSGAAGDGRRAII